MSKNKIIIQKLANIVEQQQKIIAKLAQQVIDTSPGGGTDPLDKVVHDATVAWSTKNGLSASSSFEAGTDGKNYQVDVVLTITDPKKPVGPTAQRAKDNYKASFLAMLQSTFVAAQGNNSPLAGATATFNVTVN
jgi:hypothetical protein